MFLKGCCNDSGPHLGWAAARSHCVNRVTSHFHCLFLLLGAEDRIHHLPPFTVHDCHWFQLTVDYFGFDCIFFYFFIFGPTTCVELTCGFTGNVRHTNLNRQVDRPTACLFTYVGKWCLWRWSKDTDLNDSDFRFLLEIGGAAQGVAWLQVRRTHLCPIPAGYVRIHLVFISNENENVLSFI